LKALLLDGTQKDETIAQMIKNIIHLELQKKKYKINEIQLSEKNIHHCIGCFKCWLETPGICVYNDYGREITRHVVESDLLILLSPVTFGGYSSTMKKAVDRFIPIVLPFFTKIKDEFHHQPRYKKYPILIGIGILPQSNETQEELFIKLIQRNSINFHNPAHRTGIIYKTYEISEVKQVIQKCLQEVEAEC
jgi:multimeric flavodoxin WrbA